MKDLISIPKEFVDELISEMESAIYNADSYPCDTDNAVDGLRSLLPRLKVYKNEEYRTKNND